MKDRLRIVEDDWTYGSYPREEFRWDIIYTVLQYKEMNGMFHLHSGTLTLQDTFAEQMAADRIISQIEKKKYEKRAVAALLPLSRFDHAHIEEIYGELQRERKSFFGVEQIEKEQQRMAQRGIAFDPTGGIDQRRKKEEVLASCKAAIFALTDCRYFPIMKKDLENALKNGKDIYVIADREGGNDIPSKPFLEQMLASGKNGSGKASHSEGGEDSLHKRVRYLLMESRNGGIHLASIEKQVSLQNYIDEKKAVFFAYGEEGLLQCRRMKLDSVVYAVPSGYFAKTVTNQLGETKACVVYIPAGFDVIRWVPIMEKTRISYAHLARLWEMEGDSVYSQRPEELYLCNPRVFMNIYGRSGPNSISDHICLPDGHVWYREDPEQECSGADDVFAKKSISGEVVPKQSDTVRGLFRQFDQRRDRAIREFFHRQGQLQYESAYFNDEMERTEIPWACEEQQRGIFVQAIRVSKNNRAFVKDCEGKMLRNALSQTTKTEQGWRLISNFLFFLTPGLVQVYNAQRRKRPEEQISFAGGHLDYLYETENGERRESFPLFRKACLGRKRNGQYLFFHFALAGGTVTIAGKTFRWKKEDVDPVHRAGWISLYTPLYAEILSSHAAEGISSDKDQCFPVGEGRINLVVVQNEIICVRKGAVLLSGIGVVISLEETFGKVCLEEMHAVPKADGYYELEKKSCTIRLEQPEEVSRQDWEELEWAYGGGMSLILDGVGLCDQGEDAMRSQLEKEGFLSLLSRQTQESQIQKMEKHPRTGIGVTKEGDLVILVYSGRTKLSAGADYTEMIRIARKLYPDIWNLMNVDGGGSAMLGIAMGQDFMELSYPAVSVDSCVGMARPVHTILEIEF